MSRWRVAAVCVPVFALNCAAQDVPPPPRPANALVPLLESFKQTLLSSGQIEYNTFHHSVQYTSVVVDARGCQAKVRWDDQASGAATADRVKSLFFESIDTVEVLTRREVIDRTKSRLGLPLLKNYGGTGYELVINGETKNFETYPLLFASEAQANQAAEAIRGAAQICRAAPVTLNAAAGTPSLDDTLHFIEDKVNDNGAVDYRGTLRSGNGETINSIRMTRAAADPSTCQLRFNLKQSAGADGKVIQDTKQVISFRRVQALEVATEQDANNGYLVTEPVIYRLTVKYPGSDSVIFGLTNILRFSNEEIANRIAKAMNHAVELCGGGNKEPF